MAARFQAATAFFQIYAQLDRPLKRRFWRVLLLSGSVSLLELVITASLSLLGIALAAPESLQQMEGIQWLVRTFPALGPVAADQKTLLVWLLAGLCGALAFKSLSLAFLTWRSADFAQAVGVFFSTRFFALLLLFIDMFYSFLCQKSYRLAICCFHNVLSSILGFKHILGLGTL